MLAAVAFCAAAPAYAGDDPGAYVRARIADAEGRSPDAATAYAQALTASPTDEVIAIRAYRAALEVGDMALALKAANVLARADVAPADASILLFADAVQRKDREGAKSAARRLVGGPLTFLSPTLQAWLAFDAGEDPMPMIEAGRRHALSRRYGAEHRALLLIALKRPEEGIAALRALEGTADLPAGLERDAALLLAASGEKQLARSLSDDPNLLRDARMVRPGTAFGASRLFARLAGDLLREETVPVAISLGRAALLLDLNDVEARIALSEALSLDGAADEALAVLRPLGKDRRAVAMSVGVLSRAGRDAEAVTQARQLANAPGAGSEDAQALGDLLALQDDYAGAAVAYGLAIDRAGANPGWQLLFQRATALDRSGKWNEALPLLRKALEIAPDEAVVLNYLGYALAERGENLAEAQKLLERADQLLPDNPSITDSLGWAYYQRGEVAKALPLLERAARARPAGAAINEHLGDAYWRLGRRYEARYAWSAAALYADAEDADRIEGKLASGLAPVQRD